MITKSGITLGEWKYELRNGQYELLCPTQETIIGKLGLTAYPKENEANAEFICLCANQCQAVNPTHPEYVAEGIGKMRQALIWCAEYLGIRESDGEKPNRADCARIVAEVLANIERGE
jgi:hypothetical protein